MVDIDRAPSLDKAAALLALHEGPGFVLPNAWDVGSARILERAGFPAIATTSAGIAWASGVADGGALDRDTMLAHIDRIVAGVGVPVSADLESGYGTTAHEVGQTVARAVDTGVVGANLEDAVEGRLFNIDEAAERIAAARAAAPRGSFVLNARTDTSSGPFKRRPCFRARARLTSCRIPTTRPAMSTPRLPQKAGRARSVSP